ncbi:hydroxyacid dehydrogenase [Lampropedia cohaerens]|uniref:Hydroxyacid dehydrogenase n=2 Tax=Lampropedia cohaerens TaxID=1610491 RepID=A0A0U1Q0H3_9BURK|nr:hydroxyacid dehydrogenase [Lampropedia cohaerens]
MNTYGYAAYSCDTSLAPFRFKRRALRREDVAMEVLYCGVCHSDLHTARNDWKWSVYPVVPGHEIIGRVTAVGEAVSAFKVGELVAVGCMVDSCLQCRYCTAGEEQMCVEKSVGTYNGVDRITGERTMGGYAKTMVVREEFCLHLPPSLDVTRAAPLLCAGITTYSPLRAWNVGAGTRLAVVGLGGLGHMAVKLGVAMGAHVTVISRSPDKEADALALGAHRVLVSGDVAAMEGAADAFDVILDTVPVAHSMDPYLPLLKADGTLVLVGQIGPMPGFSSLPVLGWRRRISGSHIGGIRETQEMLDFCAQHNVLPDVEMIRMDQINEAFERMERADVRYRFVIDMATLTDEQAPAAAQVQEPARALHVR